MVKDPLSAWWTAGMEVWKLAMDASAVMTLRAAKIARGDTAAVNVAHLMIREKVQAAIETQIGLMTGAFGTSPEAVRRKLVRRYGAKIRSNRRRLER